MAKIGRRFTFHGAFASKTDAVQKERAVGGFIQPRTIRGQRRYVVMTEGGTVRRRKKNPLLLEYLNPPAKVAGRIPGTLEEIRYRRTGKHAGPFKHKFKTRATIYTLTDGGLVIRPNRKGDKLWVDLPD